MKVIFQNLKTGEIKLLAQTLDDLWYLSQVIDEGDLVTGRTERKIKVGKEEEKSAKKTFTVKLKTEQVEFHESSNRLRISGIIIEAPETIPKGVHQTIDVEEGTAIKIQKEQWLGYQLEKIKEASSAKFTRILLCILDRELAYFVLLKSQGYEILAELHGDVEKKYDKSVKGKGFYPEIIKKLDEYNDRLKLEKIILASPAFWKEDLLKEIKNDSLRKRIVTATCSSVDKTGIEEVLKRPELKTVLKDERIAKEASLMEDVLKEISRDGAVTYGFNDVENAANSGAVKTLLVTDKLIHRLKASGEYKKIDRLMKSADNLKGEIFVLNSKNDPGKRLDSLGGIAALLRYKSNY